MLLERSPPRSSPIRPPNDRLEHESLLAVTPPKQHRSPVPPKPVLGASKPVQHSPLLREASLAKSSQSPASRRPLPTPFHGAALPRTPPDHDVDDPFATKSESNDPSRYIRSPAQTEPDRDFSILGRAFFERELSNRANRGKYLFLLPSTPKFKSLIAQSR
jgi:hypothetical protein